MPSEVLQNTQVVITRPEPMGAGLSAKLAELGAESFSYPTLSIEAISLTDDGAITLDDARQPPDKIIFVSRNAVLMASKSLDLSKLATSCQLFAVGQGTQAELAKHTKQPIRVPEQENTEGLLAMPELQRPAGQRIWIVKGEGGRQLLEATLVARGATVRALPCYRRVPLDRSPEGLLSWWRQSGGVPTWIVITSGESLQQLHQLLTNHPYAKSHLSDIQQLVSSSHYLIVSQRIADLALTDALLPAANLAERAVIAKGACDRDLIGAIIEYQSSAK